MATSTNAFSKITDRFQTTVPSDVRERLKLGRGDRIRYCMEPGGRVYIEPAGAAGGDPALGAFLDLIEADMAARPDRLTAIEGSLRDRMAGLVRDVEIDLDAALSPDDE